MISYQTYKLINEASFNLGLSQKPALGIVGSNLAEMGLEKKAPIVDDELEDMGDMGDEMGMDGEEEMGDFPPDEGLEGEMGDEMGDEMGEMEPCFVCNPEGEDMGQDPSCEACGGEGWIPAEGGEEGEDPLMGDEEMGDEEMPVDDMGDEEEMVFMKKPMRKHMSPDELEDEENDSGYYSGGYDDHDDTDDYEVMRDRDGNEVGMSNAYDRHSDQMDQMKSMRHRRAGMRKHMSKGGCCGGRKHMAKEHVEEDNFMESLSEQLSGDFTNTYFSGLKEEILLAMQGEEESSEPKPGDVGFAPQGKIGDDVGSGHTMDDIDLPTLGED